MVKELGIRNNREEKGGKETGLGFLTKRAFPQLLLEDFIEMDSSTMLN